MGITAAKDTIGDLDDPMFDLVMICLPPGQSDILAFAFNNSKYSFYNDEWCGYVDAQMHEVGHNLGLAHSGSLEEGEYGDTSGLMGVSPVRTTTVSATIPRRATSWVGTTTKHARSTPSTTAIGCPSNLPSTALRITGKTQTPWWCFAWRKKTTTRTITSDTTAPRASTPTRQRTPTTSRSSARTLAPPKPTANRQR